MTIIFYLLGKLNLQPTWDAIANAIENIDKKHLFFYEPVTWGIFFNENFMDTGFTHVPGGSNNKNRSVLSYHYYWLTL